MAGTHHHERLLRRARRQWDRVSVLGGTMERAAAEVDSYALEHLDGQAVLDIGCGSEAALPALRAAVGPSGRVVGIDYSPRMLARAQRRILAHNWDNVETRQADFRFVATKAPASRLTQAPTAQAADGSRAHPLIRDSVTGRNDPHPFRCYSAPTPSSVTR